MFDMRISPGDRKFVATDLDHLGDWVARILTDERTLNRSVLVWEYATTIDELWTLFRPPLRMAISSSGTKQLYVASCDRGVVMPRLI